MERKRPILELMVQAAGLPEEMLPGTPLIELCGSRRLLVENHCGVLEYAPERICVALKRGRLLVRGRKLNLQRMRGDTLIVTGFVEGLDFETGVTP